MVRPNLDLYRRLLLGPEDRTFAALEVDAEIDALLVALRGLRDSGAVHLSRAVAAGSAKDIRHAALQQLSLIHDGPVRDPGDGTIVLADPTLAHYYANRLDGYPLPAPRPSGSLS